MTNLSYERAQAPFLEASKRDVGEVFGDTILVASTVGWANGDIRGIF